MPTRARWWARPWRHIDLAGGQIKVPGTKTDAAERIMPLGPALREALIEHKAACRDPERGALVFPTSKGRKLGATNVRRRVLAPAVERANKRLAEHDIEPLPEGLTPHSLRRTYASLNVALGTDPARLRRQMGHTTAHMTMNVYAAAMDWAEGECERLHALWDGCFDLDRATTGNSAAETASESLAPASAKSPDPAL